MVTDPHHMHITRRQALLQLAVLATMPFAPGIARAGIPPRGIRFATAWDREGNHHTGMLEVTEQDVRVAYQLTTPTRAHGSCAEPDGTWLTVARRPGDWLVRWHPDGRPPRWQWIEPARAFNGHALSSPDGSRVFTTETDLETGTGLIGVRDGQSLEKFDEWSSGGMDPHELLWVPGQEGLRLVVANGGIPTLPETGRIKIQLDRMDSSLALLDASSGHIQGQWRLPDQRLSMRHIAWHPEHPGMLGLALQAEHDTLTPRLQAPILAIWQESTGLQTATNPPLQGYGGDIAAVPNGFAVSTPKANGVALWQWHNTSLTPPEWRELIADDQACALCHTPDGLWIAAAQRAHLLTNQPSAYWPVPPQLRIDNHWVAV